MGERRWGIQISARDVALLRWVGEQYSVRADLLGALMARHSDDPSAQARGALVPRVVTRRIQAWREAGLVRTKTFLMGTASTVWLTADGMTVAGLPWRPYEPTLATVAHRHAVGLVRAEAETITLGGAAPESPRRGSAPDPPFRWICERELREGQGGRPLHLPDGVVESVDGLDKTWRTAVEVELTRKTEARVAGILRHLLAAYDDVVYRVHVRPFPPPTLAAIA